MKNLLNLTESEKSRILNLHKSAIKKEFLFEQRMDTEGKNVEMYNNDKDYDYKKEGDKYFFKLKATPKSEKAKSFLAQKKFINWTEAKSGPGLDAIKALPFQAVAPPPPNTDGSDEAFEPPVQTTNTDTTPTTGPDAVTGAVTPDTSLSNTQTQTTPTTAAGASATTPLKTGKEIRQDYRQQQRQTRQTDRRVKKDKKQLEKELKDLQSTYQRLLPKMTPDVKKSYESKIGDLIVQVNKA